MKSRDEEIEDLITGKKKSSKEQEALQTLIDELRANNAKLEKSKKRLQEEVVVVCFVRGGKKSLYRVCQKKLNQFEIALNVAMQLKVGSFLLI